MTLPHCIYGIDFSGMGSAGKKIWVAEGTVDNGCLLVTGCRRGDTLSSSGLERDRCLAALRDLITAHPDSLFAFDFPFGLPRSLVPDPSWDAFVLSFPQRYPSAAEFRAHCRAATPGSELKRLTDRATRVPFAAYNVRLFRQTYYGIRDLLHPLVHRDLVSVLPMQEPAMGRAWLIEICPASTLKREGLYTSYKGRGSEHRERRRRILEALENTGMVEIVPPGLRSVVIDEPEGDALDCVIAAYAAFRSWRGWSLAGSTGPELFAAGPLLEERYQIEGYVYT